jgi:hypothetical protein
MSEEFPSFQKEKISEDFQSRSSAFFFIAILVLLTGLSIFASFRFLSGSKTSRNEILARILEASESRQTHLLLEWIQHLNAEAEGNAQEVSWKPSAQEQKELLSWTVARISDLKKAGNTPAILALHVASQGPGISYDEVLLKKIIEGSQSVEARLALGLYLSRQKVLTPEVLIFFEELSTDASLILRKVTLPLWEQCLMSLYEKKDLCEKKINDYLKDSNDELRWNAAFSVIRLRELIKPEMAQQAEQELRVLKQKIFSKDPELFSRFSAEVLQAISSEIKRHAL